MKVRTLIRRPLATASVALLIGAALSGCATSQAQVAPTDVPPPVTTSIPMATDVTIQIAGPMPTAQPVPTLVVPTAAPIPAAPIAGADLTGVEVGSADFSSPDLSGWSSGQIYADPLGNLTWTVKDGTVVAPNNEQSLNPFNDTFSISPFSLKQNGTVAVSTFSEFTPKVGVVVGYQDSLNYVAVIFGSEIAPGTPGLNIVQVSNGQSTLIAQNKTAVMSLNRWHDLRVTIANNTIIATVGKASVKATLSTPLAGQRVGLYAGSEGFARFDNLRVVAN